MAAVILAIVYAYSDVHSPVAVLIPFLFLIGLTFGVGWLVSRLGYAGNCRNTNFLRVVGLVCGLVALYVSWAAFEYALLRRVGGESELMLLDMVFSPLLVWDTAGIINSDGWYSVGDFTPSGIVLWGLWGVVLYEVNGLVFKTDKKKKAEEEV